MEAEASASLKPDVATPASHDDPGAAGWDCHEPEDGAEYRKLLPPEERNLFGLRRKSRSASWLRPSTLLASRNDVVARIFGDPAPAQRGAWMDCLAQDEGWRARWGEDGRRRRIDRTDLAAPLFLVVGDPGEGDASQYVTVPAIRDQASSFMIAMSDVIYPAGDVNQYLAKFYYPYKDYRGPIYAIPGNHDWYDSLSGFMQHFCAAEPLKSRPPTTGFRGWFQRHLWRRARLADPVSIEAGRGLRPAPEQALGQPAPYWVIDTGPLQLVGIDTGIRGELDEEQGRWLLEVSKSSPGKPKILLTGKPLIVDGNHEPCRIIGLNDESGAPLTVDAVVRNREHRYVAAIGGDIHNYQRYFVDLGDRWLPYVVAGGGGAFMHATHRIGRVELQADDLRAGEDDFRCYPLRGDSLAIFSRLVSRRLGLGDALSIPRPQAAAIMAKQTNSTPTRAEGKEAQEEGIRWSSRAKAAVLRHVGGRLVQRYLSEIFDWNEPPMFKHFLLIEAGERSVRIQCLAATGCPEHEREPPVEDDFTIHYPPAR